MGGCGARNGVGGGGGGAVSGGGGAALDRRRGAERARGRAGFGAFSVISALFFVVVLRFLAPLGRFGAASSPSALALATATSASSPSSSSRFARRFRPALVAAAARDISSQRKKKNLGGGEER
jgi:hypothetical protein